MGAMALLQSHAGVGFQMGMRFQAIAFSYPPRSHPPPSPRPRPLRVGAWSSSPTPTRRSRPRRHPSCRSYSTLFSSVDDASGIDGNASNVPEGQNTPSSRGNDDDTAADGIGDGGAVKPEPRADEQMAGSIADAAVSAAGTGPSVVEEGAAAVVGEEQVDWDKAWASTRQRMEQEKRAAEQEKRAAPAFSGRKQIVTTKNAEGGYDYEEISADGSRRMRGAKGSGGFGFADSNQVEDGPGRIRRQEQEAVNLATTNKAFAGLFALLLASLIFEVYVFMSGGITNGSTRFQNVGQPTTYDALPMPATPPADDDLTV